MKGDDGACAAEETRSRAAEPDPAGKPAESTGMAVDSAGMAVDAAGTAVDAAGTAVDSEGTALPLDRTAPLRQPRGGILGRVIRNQQLWLTLGYFAVLLLLARAYA